MNTLRRAATAATAVAACLAFVPGASGQPGNAVVHDDAGDLQLRSCLPAAPALPCSLPPGAPLASPAWTDLAGARITQLGRERVDLVLRLQEPVPDAPPFFVAYAFVFENGCRVGDTGLPTGPTEKDAAVVVWDGSGWHAHWLVVTDCDPRTAVAGAPIPFAILDDTIRMRVPLSELVARAGEPLEWYAVARRLPFVHPLFTATLPVDVAPDIFAFAADPPPIVVQGEAPAHWAPR